MDDLIGLKVSRARLKKEIACEVAREQWIEACATANMLARVDIKIARIRKEVSRSAEEAQRTR